MKSEIMHLLLFMTALLCEAFHPTWSFTTVYNKHGSDSSTTLLRGIHEWRDQVFESKYTLDCYTGTGGLPAALPPTPLPILPFPFYDILVQGERKQLNLYEERFHELFGDALEKHCGMIGMGLVAGNGMITTIPLCEIESFTHFGADEDWRDKGDGMGNGSILVTIRAVGRCKIAGNDLLQEEPYMKAQVVEISDADVMLEGKKGEIRYAGLKEKSKSNVRGESSTIEVASLVAENIEKLIVSLGSMENRLQEAKGENDSQLTSAGDSVARKAAANEEADSGDAMNRRLVNARLESLFTADSSEGLDMENVEVELGEMIDDDGDESESEEDDEDMDRVARFQQAVERAKEVDTFGYVNPKQHDISLRIPKDLTAISWAAFIGDSDDMQQVIMKIQAQDFTNVLQRLQLGAAMLREEEKTLKAKLALAGIQGNGIGEENS